MNAKHTQDTMWDDAATLCTLPKYDMALWRALDHSYMVWDELTNYNQSQFIWHVLSFGPEDGDMPQDVFDAIKPAWMPTAAQIVESSSRTWTQLNNPGRVTR